MSKPVILANAWAAPMLGDQYEVVSPPTPDKLADFVRDTAPRVEAVVTFARALPQPIWDAMSNLKLISVVSAGYETFDIAELRAKGITLTNCPGLNAEDVADVAIGLMISVMRNIAIGDARVKAGAFRDRTGMAQARRIKGRKVGIVGLGAIGSAFAARAEGFGVEIAWTGPRAKPETGYRFEPSLLELAKWADILCVCTRADPGTEKMIGEAVLRALGKDGVLINISRGSVVDEDALIALLKSGELGGAGLDVFQREPTPAERWKDVPNTTLTPHFGGGTRESLQDNFALCAENIRLFFEGKPVKTPVN